MADSTLNNTGETPPTVSGKDKRTLGPSDTTDSGSDLVGTDQVDTRDENTSDSHNTGEAWGEVRSTDGPPGSDIEPDKIVNREGKTINRENEDADGTR